ncbi:MAG: hypothetical protein IJ604_12925 [Prevotella sp.]|nr:hypothetical protein [Prevotella sp.]
MKINSNEEYCPVEELCFLKGPYYLVSCKSSEQEFSCVAESDENAVRISFQSHVAYRITNSSFRDYDMRNRFCEHVIYTINNSYYHETVCSNLKNQKDLSHFLISLDDTIIDVIASEPIKVTISKCLDETERDISENKEHILGVKEIYPPHIIHSPYTNFDNFSVNQDKEFPVAIGNLIGNYAFSRSDYDAVDLKLIINPLNGSEEDTLTIFPKILCYNESVADPKELDNSLKEKDSARTSVMLEIQNSSFKEWLSYAGYNQLYGEPTSLRHIRVILFNRTYDILLDANDEQPYCLKENAQHHF